MRALWVAVALCAMACGESEPDAVDGGGGGGGDELGVCEGDEIDQSCRGEVVPETLEGCYVGAQFANCGGSGEPRLACGDSIGCRWFVGGRAPESMTVNCCPEGDLCCDGSAFFNNDSSFFAYSWGLEPWDDGREVGLDVVTMTAESSGDLSVSCQGLRTAAHLDEACSNAYVARPLIDADAALDTHVLDLYADAVFGGVSGQLEVFPGIDAGARLCFYPFTDAGSCYEACDPDYPGEPTCATAGVVRISPPPWDDETLAGVVTAEFADGTTMTIRF